MTDFAIKPDETDFLTKYSNTDSEEEKARLKREYDTQVEAYWDWMNDEKRRNAYADTRNSLQS